MDIRITLGCFFIALVQVAASQSCGGCGGDRSPGSRDRACERHVPNGECIGIKQCTHTILWGMTTTVPCHFKYSCQKTERWCCPEAFGDFSTLRAARTDELLSKSKAETDELHSGPMACLVPTWASWSAWSACTKTCGGWKCGTRHRHRTCTDDNISECKLNHKQVESEACGSNVACESIQMKPCPGFRSSGWWFVRSRRENKCPVQVESCCDGMTLKGNQCVEN